MVDKIHVNENDSWFSFLFGNVASHRANQKTTYYV